MTAVHTLSTVLLFAGSLIGLACSATSTSSSIDKAAPREASVAKPTIVLVHGAFADATGWARVVTLLDAKGFNVVAVQNSMDSLADDIANTRRFVEAQKGPVVLVGHSYGGAVITGAGADSPNVKALVYVAAFAPDVGESLQSLLDSVAPSKVGPSLVPDAAGYLYIDRAQFQDVFAGDLPSSEARMMASTQRPIRGAIFGEPSTNAAWRKLPTWYLVASQDHAINPDLQRKFAKRMGAKTAEVRASHVPFLSQPDAVVGVIAEAARSIQ